MKIISWEKRSISSVSVVTRLWGGKQGKRVTFLARTGVILFSTPFKPVLGSSLPPILWLLNFFYLDVKLPGHKDDHSSPSSTTELRMHGDNTPPSPLKRARTHAHPHTYTCMV